MRSRPYGIYFFTITVLLFLVAWGAIYILLMDYDLLVISVVASVHKNGLEEKIRNSLFTRNRFRFVQHLTWLVLVLVPFCFWLAMRYRLLISRYCGLMIQSVLRSPKAVAGVYKNNSPLQNRSVLTLLAIVIIFYTWRMINSFPGYDEMWSYNYYTAGHFYYSFFTYSSYPLFEMTTHFFKKLPFPMYINLRLSPFIFGISSCFVLYACLRKYFSNHFTAMAGLTVFAFMPFTVSFMVNARGVMHELFFAIAGIFSFLFWMENPARKKWLVIYFIAGVLGLYSMSTHVLFLFFLLVAGLWVLAKKEKASALLLLKINILILACFLILYAPILLTTGIPVYTDLLANAPSYYGAVLHLPSVILYVFMDYAGRNYISLLVFLSAMPLLLLQKNKLPGKLAFLSNITLCLPVSLVVFCLLTKFDYPGRALAFGSLSIPLLACLFMQAAGAGHTKNNEWKKRIVIAAIAAGFLLPGYFPLPARPIYKWMALASGLFLEKKISSCYDNSSPASGFYYYYPALEYYYRMEHKTIELTLSAKNSMRYKPLLPNDRYDCIVYDINVQDSSRAESFHEIYRDPFGKFKIWMRNDLH